MLQQAGQSKLEIRRRTWREFQVDLKKQSRGRSNPGRLWKRSFLAALVMGILYGINLGASHLLPDLLQKTSGLSTPRTGASNHQDASPSSPGRSDTGAAENTLCRRELRALLGSLPLINAETNQFTLEAATGPLTITTSIDPSLQAGILENLDSLKTLTRGKPQRIGIVAMEPETGKIIAMAGFDLDDASMNTCTISDYPAASVFKIVTAAAAIETCGLYPDSNVYFNGGKYTLYKRQIKKLQNKHTNRVSFAHAFAESINPVFGKLGALYLGGDTLEKYAAAFGFNTEVNCELDLDPGSLTITDSSYQWAEVGCGFNKTTTISPVFGAMMSSTIVNEGRTPCPSLVETVTDSQGDFLYRRTSAVLNDAVKPATAEAMMTMMGKTISSGTARSAFQGYQRDTTLSQLQLGGKTGSLYNSDNTVKYDWFTGFAREARGSKTLVVSIVVGHRKYIGTRAATYGKQIFKDYFTRYFASKATAADRG